MIYTWFSFSSAFELFLAQFRTQFVTFSSEGVVSAPKNSKKL